MGENDNKKERQIALIMFTVRGSILGKLLLAQVN